MFALAGTLALLIAQASPPGQRPGTATTPCPLAVPSHVQMTFPVRVAVTPASAANFARFNQDGHGSFMIIAHLDGTMTPIVPATRDIDAALKASILDYAARLKETPAIACSNVSGIFLLRFEVPSGDTSAVRVEAPEKPLPSPSP